jgi:hypothetical protein
MKWFKRAKAKNNDSSFVNVLDQDTHTVTRVPARELASHMVEVQMEGIEGTVWMDARELKQSEYRHPPFSEEIRDILREIKSSIDEFYDLSLEQWEDGFRRDTNPEKEIAIWVHLANIYRSLATSRDLSAEQRQDYFKVLICCLNSPREHVLKVFSPSAISVEEANDVIAQFYKAGD